MKNDNNVCGVRKCAIQHGNALKIVIDIMGMYIHMYVYCIILRSFR